MRKMFFTKELFHCFPVNLLFLSLIALPLYGQNDVAGQASELMRAGRFHDAELLWRQLEHRYPENASVHSNLGIALAQQGELRQAADEYRKSLTLKPDQSDVAFNLGLAELSKDISPQRSQPSSYWRRKNQKTLVAHCSLE